MTAHDDLRARLEAEANTPATFADASTQVYVYVERALLREAAARLGESEWRDISEAPKDGTRILLWGRYWSDEQGWFRTAMYGQWDGNASRWIVWGPGGRFGVRPTHFMPLPSPPESTNE